MVSTIDIPGLNKYIPAGCLKLSVVDTNLISPESWKISNSQSWKFFSRRLDDIPESACLPSQAQEALLKLPILQPFIGSWQSRWIQMSFSLTSCVNSSSRIRVYILPQDVDRSTIDLRNELMRATSLLISQLDFSLKSWNGEEDSYEKPMPQSEGLPNGEPTSLLTMFNNVPSPDPLPELETNPDTRDGMQCLLESQVPGLTTKLYPYQGRSAALMLQREENPGRIVDPRFRSVLDQEGQPWYFDNVSGIVLREPRYYDGVRGGILAEEMGTGKTLICLALILCTKSEPTKAPEPFVAEVAPRLKSASLLDMAAATANKNSIAWKPYFEASATRFGYEYRNCIDALTRLENRALYKVQNTLVEPRRSNRTTSRIVPPKEVYLSHATLVIVPNNLVKQWQNEMKKHTTGLNTLVLVEKQSIPPVTTLLGYDLIIFSESRFEWIQRERSNKEGPTSDIYCPLEYIRFKRCIIDEGHKLGNKSRSWKSDVMRVLDRLEIAARWVVTGTPSRGLYGIEQQSSETKDKSNNESTKGRVQSTLRQEREDLQRIGNLAAKYLKVRPWANTKDEAGDSVADWNTYMMHPEQHAKGHNRKDCLRTALNSLIIRHQLPDVSTLLPPVEEKIVLLDGSFQDKLSLNLFSMMIIFNSVQSQRTDMDYFFHERQRKSLAQLVRNLRQACFFGGVFYSAEDIAKALETAEGFLEKKDIPISGEDEDLLRQAIDFGKIAVNNRLKDVSNTFHAMPLYIDNFPGGGGKNWSLDDSDAGGQPICTDAGMVHALQRFLNPCIDAPTSLQLMIESGRLDQQGAAERSQALMAAMDASGYVATQPSQASALAGNTALGGDYHAIPKSGTLGNATQPVIENAQGIGTELGGHVKVAEPLAKTRIISTVSAKLSYLIDSIVKYQDEEQIIVFYDNENIAYYLAGMLEILQIQHLIYARAGLSADRRAQYVATFTHNPKFRVLLMDISQAAFGLDMRSASRIYFISPVLNPQVEAQAIGRARRISQQKPVSVETLVLRNSIEEVIINRRKEMTYAEHSKVKSILDDRLIYRWILNAKIIPLPDEEDGVAQTAMLETPQYVFGRGSGRELHPDEGLITGSPDAKVRSDATTSIGGPAPIPFRMNKSLKRMHSLSSTTSESPSKNSDTEAHERPPKRSARVAFAV
ncbi:putative ATP-dependent helicase C23E6.02 [Daldinia childiae]|uniref:putative ATP-dependent helicase C23E6.02 n=1 Tax=Daldinia childiae TaxID=326645 RepID=UPI001446594A|nr:putative ATP-dependent helicase C23E6.02 [Daldinia childiae]KAF3062482.1 putative ATP-dependent helicase C23E6.02 [Daldinia childiae]